MGDYGADGLSRQTDGTTDEHGLTQMRNAGWFILSVFIGVHPWLILDFWVL
jgi:hypothetical protein